VKKDVPWLEGKNNESISKIKAPCLTDVMHGFKHLNLQITMKKRLGVNIPHSFHHLSKNVHNGRFIDFAV